MNDIVRPEETDILYELDENNNLVAIDCITGKAIARVTERNRYVYKTDIARAIADLIGQGKTLSHISSLPNMPPLSVISFWRKRYPDFDEAVILARKEAAEAFHDKVIDLANTTENKEDVFVNDFKAKSFKWAAEKADPSRYGNQTKIVGDANQPLQFIIDTGVRRDALPEVENHIEGECHEQKQDAEKQRDDGAGVEPVEKQSADGQDEGECDDIAESSGQAQT